MPRDMLYRMQQEAKHAKREARTLPLYEVREEEHEEVNGNGLPYDAELDFTRWQDWEDD